MKIPYKHLIKHIESNPSIEELSKNLFQLGHEHEIENNIFNFELTPNRGDCFSLIGILRELKIFYEVDIKFDTYKKDLKSLDINFENEEQNLCNIISFMNVEINDIPKSYNKELNDYFNDLQINKNNFFTDVSNFISYEMGQPTHCYDAFNINKNIILKNLQGNYKFKTLLDKEIELTDNNLVFLDKHNNIINLAGVVGGKDSACSDTTKNVLIECAYFNPEAIIGKSLKYDIKSDAAHKFERGVDPSCHELVLRRFLKIIDMHAEIKNAEIVHKIYNPLKDQYIDFDTKIINKILGTNISDKNCTDCLSKLGFTFDKDKVLPPSYRSDIETQNDVSEEIARAIGYDNITEESFQITKKSSVYKRDSIYYLKQLLFDHGFYEVINNPFVKSEASNAIKVDNPLDSNRQYLRTSLQDSLVNNLLYNERRQKDSIKLFEVSDIYTVDYERSRKLIGIIASGRVGRNYKDFSKKINNNYLHQILSSVIPDKLIRIKNIPRDTLNSKSKNLISYIEIDLSDLSNIKYQSKRTYSNVPKFNKYNPISDLPCASRDISFSVKIPKHYRKLEDYIFSYNSPILREVFVFDFFNKNNEEIKIGFRFIFQSMESTITDNDINVVIDEIVQETNKIQSVSIPGINLTN